MNEIELVLDECKNISLDKKIVKEAVNLNKISKVKLKFKDLIIAATAKVYRYTLLTADQDFKKLEGVKVELFKV